MKYYAVLYNNEENIFDNWEDCQSFLKNKKGYKMKSFLTLEEAKNFFMQQEIPSFEEPTAFIDGSFNENTNEYSFGGVLIYNHQEYRFKKKYSVDEFSSARNVAGEIKGAGYIINYAIRHSIPKLHIYYDYEGIEKWYTKEWKANSKIAMTYVAFVDRIQNQIEVCFHKVQSHTNNYYNDIADTLAKEALGL